MEALRLLSAEALVVSEAFFPHFKTNSESPLALDLICLSRLVPSKPSALHGCEAVQTTAWGEVVWCQFTFRSDLSKQGFRHAQCSGPSHLIFICREIQTVTTTVRQDGRKTGETVTPSCW